jgi:uncharacterized cofD-like protein
MLIKRWAVVFMLGVVLVSIAMAMAVAYTYRYYPFPEPISGFIQLITLQFLDRWVRLVLVFSAGAALMTIGFVRLSRSLLSPFLARSTPGKQLAEIVAEHRFGHQRPPLSVVAIGGGTGLSTLLRGLKHHDLAITAIVTVADDGGSTGRIRSEFDIPAPGDIRNCLVALADDESLVSRLFQYRFDEESSHLNGHSLGNLFITALTRVTGSFEQAVIESGHVLAIRGRVLPSTVENVTLSAELVDGTILRGESNLCKKEAPIKRVFLEPGRPSVYDPAFSAILNADLVILGPGSLYTSVVPNLLVEGITQAIRWSRGKVVYACNVATQPGETDNFDAMDHIRVITEQLGPGVLTHVVVNSNPASASAIGPDVPVDPILPEGLEELQDTVAVVARDVVSDRNPLRHDPDKLARALLDLAHDTHTGRNATSSPNHGIVPVSSPPKDQAVAAFQAIKE